MVGHHLYTPRDGRRGSSYTAIMYFHIILLLHVPDYMYSKKNLMYYNYLKPCLPGGQVSGVQQWSAVTCSHPRSAIGAPPKASTNFHIILLLHAPDYMYSKENLMYYYYLKPCLPGGQVRGVQQWSAVTCIHPGLTVGAPPTPSTSRHRPTWRREHQVNRGHQKNN